MFFLKTYVLAANEDRLGIYNPDDVDSYRGSKKCSWVEEIPMRSRTVLHATQWALNFGLLANLADFRQSFGDPSEGRVVLTAHLKQETYDAEAIRRESGFLAASATLPEVDHVTFEIKTTGIDSVHGTHVVEVLSPVEMSRVEHVVLQQRATSQMGHRTDAVPSNIDCKITTQLGAD